MTDKVIIEILERERDYTRERLDEVTGSIQRHREWLANAETDAADLTGRLDAIEAELGVGAFAELST